jgi:hypothetical protein
VPYFDLATNAYGEVSAGGRKGEGGDLAAEGEVVEYDSAGDVGEDGAAIFVDGEKQVAARVQCEAGDVASMRKGKCVGL